MDSSAASSRAYFTVPSLERRSLSVGATLTLAAGAGLPLVQMTTLSDTYEQHYADLLAELAAVHEWRPRARALFWPKIGRLYGGEVLVVGRAVNGWIDRWEPDDRRSPTQLAAIARATAEGTVNGCPMGWVPDRWGKRDGGYDTARSQFWERVRRVMVGLDPSWAEDWPSRLAWTNLAKVAPYDGGNPGSASLRVQRGSTGTALLVQEVGELAPRRIVALTDHWWFSPFATALGVEMEPRHGLVEAVGRLGDRRIVVAVHPMTRSPAAVAIAVLRALQ